MSTEYETAEEFVVPGEIGVHEQEGSTGDQVSVTKFPVLPSLVIIGFVLFGLFGALIIPTTLSYLHLEPEEKPEFLPLPEVAAVTHSINFFNDLPLRAEAAYVYDAKNQQVLFEKNAEEILPLASITKLMTILLSYELVEDDTVVTISNAAANQQSGGTLSAGEKFLAKDLADFALISSYNSAAFTLADSVGALLGDNDGQAQFVAAMNIRAEELGFLSMSFFNPTGLDVSATEAGGYGSAKDVSLLVEYITKNYPEILLPTLKPTTKLYNTAGQYHEGDNTNELISDIPNLLGSKTGYTDLAGGNLTIVFDAGFNHPIIVTVLGSTRSERFADVKRLIAATLATAQAK